MKNYKKISIGLSLIVVAMSLLLSFFEPHVALADAGAGDLGASVDSFTALDSATIKATLGGSGSFNFVDNNPYPQDSTFNFTPAKSGSAYVDGLCDPGDVSNQNGVGGKIKFGVNLLPNPTNASGLKANPINAEVKLGYTPSGGLGCTPVLFKTTINNPNGVAAATYEYSGSNIINAPGFSSATFKPVPGNPNVYAVDTSPNTCGGGDMIVVNSSNSNTGTRYQLTSSKNAGNGTDAHSIAALSSVFSAGQCYLAVSPAGVVIAGTPGGTAPGGGGGGNTTTVADTSCEAQYTGPAHILNWLLCPILDGMDSIFSLINGQVEGQLNICTGTSSTTGTTCGNNLLTPQVQKSWAVFRDLATALLVVIMLVAIFAQAISVGPFDAYTIRKMLPKIVAAVILMQISWPLFKFFVDLSNDLGHGVQDLMLAPFGGASKLQFDSLIASAGTFAPAAATVGLFTALLVGTVLSGLTIMGVALLAVTAIASVFVGLLVLLFRQMLIILAMILAPIALLAWILPGTQKYWKLWSDNFTKLLFMFPLIMAMIAAGKIFAKIGTDTGGGVLGFIIVFIGFLGPLWFLPKTFKWGGQVFAAAANGTMSATKGIRGRPSKFAMKQAEINRGQRSTDRNERLSYGRGRIFDRLYSGVGGLGLSNSATGLRNSRNRSEGREAGEKAVAQAIVGSEYEQQDHNRKLVTLDFLAQGQTDPTTGLDGSNPAMQRWALDQLATFGDWDRIDGLRASGNLDERVWQSFMAKNISAVHQNAPFLSPLRRDMSQLGYHEAATWKDHTVHEFERQVMSGQIRTADGQGYEDAPDQARQLALGVDFATRALNDERVRANLSADAVATFERIRDMGSPNVTIARTPGRSPEAHLPSALMVQNNPVARQNLTGSLISSDATQSSATRIALAGRLANPELDGRSRAIMEDYVSELRTNAASSGSPEAITAYNEVLQGWHNNLAARADQAERESLAAGRSGPDVIRDRNDAQTAANDEATRIAAAGMTPL